MQLLVVEDNQHVAAALVSVLTRHGFEVLHAPDGASALAALGPRTDLVLLDLALPDTDGFEVCRRMRAVSQVPIIMVTARTELDARVKGLRLGADDYVTKPYDVPEVLARIDAVLRRGRPSEWDERADVARIAVCGFTIDLAAHEVTGPQGEPVTLSRKEFDLLALLARHAGVALHRERILREVWGSSWKGLGRTLEVHVASLRRKLVAAADDGSGTDVVQTVRGVGYRVPGKH
ncbi:response regulator transcription factor [Isoptericola sp. NEAU-Y5]|uniref:Sensory transduction protein RegX3 n=1 Tax=Isoptericola luteus TaxID=2879484 RepID=A0ABS7ZHZ7_9MICO|nr:response regulator transcription factor [Isoptericola sp. NEAU-Y5]MCA5894661.1 response regulator transcription factor [Isoptericola sp. NEAU-Y5]